jgi:hypothetical protein
MVCPQTARTTSPSGPVKSLAFYGTTKTSASPTKGDFMFVHQIRESYPGKRDQYKIASDKAKTCEKLFSQVYSAYTILEQHILALKVRI